MARFNDDERRSLRGPWLEDFDEDTDVLPLPSKNGTAHAGNGVMSGAGSFVYDDTSGELVITKPDGFQFTVSAVPVLLDGLWWFVKGGGLLREWAEALASPITGPGHARAASLAIRELRSRRPIVRAAVDDEGQILEMDPSPSVFRGLLSKVEQAKAEELRQLLHGPAKPDFVRGQDCPALGPAKPVSSVTSRFTRVIETRTSLGPLLSAALAQAKHHK